MKMTGIERDEHVLHLWDLVFLLAGRFVSNGNI